MARIIVENVANNGTLVGKRKSITEAMRDPIGILGVENNGKDAYTLENAPKRIDPFSGKPVSVPVHDAPASGKISRLALEVLDAIDVDPFFGPRHDISKGVMGFEHELMLEQSLLAMGIPFETEEQLRMRGTSKTPDILFSCPMGVKVPIQKNKHTPQQGYQCRESVDYEWKVVCWMDSKALFGDINTHHNDTLPQAEGYVHRFGPGLILYWFGHAPIEMLGDGHGDVVLVGWNVPRHFMFPTGDIVSHGDTFPSSSAKT
mmetsp:Transcript_36937/g.37241  ORF Transcript_36937/g.37241 Transcript_36937/m.37241 type:complete len:260 (-) Transcript_36937:731-1510(-)